MTFKNFCFHNEEYFKNSPEGDFIEDLKIDQKFPETENKKQMKNHLKMVGACSEAIKAFDNIYSCYLKKDSLRRLPCPPLTKS